MTVTLNFDCSIGIGDAGGMRLVGTNLNAASAALVLPLLLQAFGLATEPADAIPALTPSPAEPDEENEPGGHVCPDCGKTSVSGHGLAVHRSRAHPAKPKRPARAPVAATAIHACPHCGQTFNRPNGLTRHLHQSHPAPAAEAAPPVPVDPEPDDVTQPVPDAVEVRRCADPVCHMRLSPRNTGDYCQVHTESRDERGLRVAR